jgi:hypothetical protein
MFGPVAIRFGAAGQNDARGQRRFRSVRQQ